MANINDNTRKSKDRSWSNRQIGLWFWCLSIQWFITLPCIFGKCLGMDNLSLRVRPDGMLNLRYGQSLEIYCEDDSADNLEFEIGAKSVPSQKVNATTRRLYMEHHKRGLYTYYCHNKATRKLCPIRVLIDSALSDITDFACISENLDVLNCTWSTPVGDSLTNHTLTFLLDGNSVNACQASNLKRGKTYCFWNTTSIPRYRQMEKQYIMSLQICNVFGCNEQNFTIDHFSIVKPKSPSNLKLITHDAHSVLLQWNIPHNMADLLPSGVDHKIEYQIAKIDNTSYFRKVDASGLPAKNKTYKFLLSDLPYAHMPYEVRIYIKPKEAVKDEFWSDFTYIVFNTANERPNRPPETVVGAFDQASYEGKRVVYVYWKQLEEYEEAGANFTYKIVVHQEMRNPKTLLADSKKSLSYVILDEASLGPINIDIWSWNDKGSSLNSSHLYIPPYTDTEVLKVPSFTKLAFENGTYKISWVGIDNIDNYTVFWCQQNATQICAGRMNFTVLEPNKTNHVIDLPKESRYQFAISANSGMKTSGMVWATCDIYKDGIQLYGFPIKVNHGPAGKSSVEITWTMACTLQEGIITGYNITYCAVINDTTVCDASVEDKFVYISNPKQNKIFITDLQPYKTYHFKLNLNTIHGQKTLENASTGVTTTEDTPTSPRNVSITEVESDSLVISWDPPLHENGVIGYVIYNNGVKYCDVKNPKVKRGHKDQLRISYKIESLEGFSNYSWSVMACNTGIGSCSASSPKNGIFVRTKIGHPSKLKSPTILNNPDIIQWEKPEKAGGPVDRYQILRVKDDQHEKIFNTTNLSFSLVHCEGGVRVEKYQVRAINLDEDPYHGALTDRVEVQLPETVHGLLEYPGEWSDPSIVACRRGDGFTTAFILMAVFALVAIMYGSIIIYKKLQIMKDIEPNLPDGLGIPEKDTSIYAFGWNQSTKEEKPPSDEMLLLPNTKAAVSTDTKQKDENNCGASDHTDSTVLSEGSRCAVDRQVSTSDEGSDSSMHLDVEAVRADDAPREEEDSSSSDIEASHETSTYFTNERYNKNPASGYVQQPVVNPATGYVSSPPASAPASIKSNPAPVPSHPASSSYVTAALQPPVFTSGIAPTVLQTDTPLSSGYVRPDHAQTRSMLDFPSHIAPTKAFGPESLPIMPTLPPPMKHGADSSYIQLQSLPSHKSVESGVVMPSEVRTPAAAASSGYVSPGDAVMHKHLGHLRGERHDEPAAILDPAMSPDAYCRFSWSTDPANDNLHSLFANSPIIKSNNN